MKMKKCRNIGPLWVLLAVMSAQLLIGGREAFATSTGSAPINVKATIPSDITLIVNLFNMYDGTKHIAATIDFGDLQRVGEEYRAATFYRVEITAAANADPFELRQSATPLVRSGGFEFMPAGAYIVKMPALSDVLTFDGVGNSASGAPLGATVGDTGTAVRDVLIYASGSDTHKVLLPLDYTLSGDSALKATETIPLNQKSGAYSGTIIFTLTSK